MRIFQEIQELQKRVHSFYLLEGFLISLLIQSLILLFLNYFSMLNKYIASYSILLIPITLFLYLHLYKKPDFERIIYNSDKYFSLEERLITLWEYKDFNDPYGFKEKLVKETEDKISNKSLKESYPFKLSKFSKLLIVITILMLILNSIKLLNPPKKDTNLAFEDKKVTEEKKPNLLLDRKEKPSLKISKNIKGEKITEEKREEEISKLENNKNKELKNIEKLLSEWDFEEKKLMEELSKNKKEEGKNSGKNEGQNSRGDNQSLSQSLVPNLQGGSNLRNYSSTEQGEQKKGNSKGEGIQEGENSISEFPKEYKKGERLEFNASPNTSQKDMKNSGSLPGTAEREQKLGNNPSPRLNVNPEQVQVPSYGMDDSKKKVYLFSAPSLKENKERIESSLSFEASYRYESAVGTRIIPQDYQEIIKSYFSQ
ncbi:MAG: hypothetical protein CBR30_00220 [Dictyoglomus sp. NZ13-RE01]|nr:MAG: hypothetical protein CBR30_00220 [Dictyoglomus sp. NZ13-RE01]